MRRLSNKSLWLVLISVLIMSGSVASAGTADAATDTDTGESSSVLSQTGSDFAYGVKTFVGDTWYIYTAPARINRKSALWLAGLAITGAIIYANDQEIYDEIHRASDTEGYKPFRKLGEAVEPVGHMGNTNPYYFAILGGSYLLGIDKLTTMSAQILEAHFITGLGKNISQQLIGRRRPHEGQGPRSFERGEGTSFPSGHTINIFELATVISHHYAYLPVQIGCYTLATAVGFQRITDEQHWPSDVFAAAVFGTVTTRALLARHDASRRERESDSTTTDAPATSWLIAPVLSAQYRYVGLAFQYQF
jgi:PAP2 superfamily